MFYSILLTYPVCKYTAFFYSRKYILYTQICHSDRSFLFFEHVNAFTFLLRLQSPSAVFTLLLITDVINPWSQSGGNDPRHDESTWETVF